ncbi:MAG: ribulose-phosphate 3-epimerase [Tissierellia bacterium]|nr:ribulose-phosphate 3-epimerase [Tissierellia bacterium]
MIELSPSLLSANFYNLENDLEQLKKTQVKYLHLDIMDGNFVPNISYGPMILKHLRDKCDFVFDTHLMIENPDYYIKNFVDSGADIISVHPETTKHLHRTLKLIKSYGKKAGVVLNPHTHESVLKYLMNDVDLILVMSVNPGFGGQSFIPESIEKIRNIRKMINSSGRGIILEVDGGIKKDNASQVIEAGADLLVSGSGVFNKEGISKNVNDFYELFKRY